MYEHCGIEVNKILKNTLTDEELKSLEDEIISGVNGDFSKIKDVASDIAEERLLAKKIAKRSAVLNLRAILNNTDYITRHWSKRPDLGLKTILIGSNRDVEGARDSVGNNQRALEGEYTQGYGSDVELSGYSKEINSGMYDDETLDVIYKKKNGDDISKNSDASKAMADIIIKWYEKIRSDANKAGAWIGEDPFFMMKQSHNKNKIRKASRYTGGEFSHSDDVNYTAWKEFILSRLDGDRTFKGIDSDKHDDYLRSIWEALATGIHLMHSASGDSVNIPAGFRSLAKRMSKEKVLHFKDGKSFAEYNKKFGDGSLRETMLKSLKASADNTAMMRQLGPNPQQTLDSIFHNLQKYAADKYGTKGREMMGSRKAMDFYMSEVDGSLNIPANQMLATVSSNIRVVNSLSKLGKAAISSVTDLVYSASEFNYQGAGFLTGYKSALSGLTSGKTTAEQTELLSMLGVTMRGMIGDNIDRYSAQDSISGGMSKLMRVYFKANMLTQWTDSLRKGVSLGFSTNIAKNTHLSYNDLGDDLKRMWGLFGIEPEMWNMIRKVDTHKIDGDSFFTPEMAREIPDSDVINFLNDRGLPASETRINNIRAEIETKFRNYFSDRVEYAVLEPDARVRALSKMGLQAGTPVGEAARFITQFKSFPLTVLMKPLARDIWGRGIEESAFHKAMWQALTRGNGENIALAHTIVMSTALGYVSLVLKDLVNNKTPRDPTDPETITASMAAGGGLGIYTDFILGELRTSYGSGPISQLAGPTFGTGEDIVNIYSKMLDGDFDEAQYQSLNTAINNTPFSNLFYTRMALDYLILYNIKESMNSGFIERMERRAAETGQEFIISPR